MITGIVTGQKLKLATPVVAADSIRFLTAEFSLSPEWSGRDVFCHFWQDENQSYVIQLHENRITEEQHLDLTAGAWAVWLHGNRTEPDGQISRATSTKAALQVVESGTIDGDPFPELEPSVVEDLLQRCEAATRAAEDAARDAGASKTAAETAAGNATQAASSAAGSATRAEQSETSAAGSASSAAGAANVAAQKATEAETAASDAESAANKAGGSEREAKKAAADAAAELGKTYTKTEIDEKIRQATPADYEAVKEKVNENTDDLAEHAAELRAQSAEIVSQGERITALENEPHGGMTEEERRKLDALWKLNKGISYDFQTDSAEAYTKQIPTGAMAMDLHSIGGKSVAMNQLVSNGYINSFGVGTYHFVDISAQVFYPEKLSASYHAYLIRAKFTSNEATSVHLISRTETNAYTDKVIDTGDYTNGRQVTAIVKVIGYYNNENYFYIRPWNNSGDTISASWENLNVIDLTAMFGTGNEPTLEECQQIFTADYYPYTEPTIVSAEVDEVETVGKNLLDDSAIVGSYTQATWLRKEIVDVSKLPPNEKFAISVGLTVGGETNYALVQAVDSNGSNVKYGTQVTNGTHGYSRITVVNDGSISKVIGTYGSKAGTVECTSATLVRGGTPYNDLPYSKQTIPIPQALREAYPLHSAGTVHDEYDLINKKFIKRVGRVDLGNLTWVYSSDYDRLYSLNFASAYSANIPPTNTPANVLTEKYPAVALYKLYERTYEGIAIGNTGTLNVRDVSITTPESFRGLLLYYELAEPIETDISDLLDDSFENIEVEGGGSITFHQSNDSYHLPVPNEEEYLIALNEVSA